MFNEEFSKVVLAANNKVELLKSNKLGYFTSSMLAGVFVGLATMLIFTIGGLLNPVDSPLTKIVMGLSFGGALSLVVFAGSELFTGNNLVMASGYFNKSVSLTDVLKIWITSFVGNLTGSILVAYMFFLSGLSTGAVGEFIVKISSVKMTLPPSELFFRGIFCNILVCLAVWCTYRCKEESSKLIMIFWCLFMFITTGFEHSVANMTLLAIGIFTPHPATVSILGYAYNLLFVTLGNMVGGIFFVALPYYLISKKKIN